MTIRSKLIIILLAATVLPLIVLVAASYVQITDLGTTLSGMAVSDSTNGAEWICTDEAEAPAVGGISTNAENDDQDGFHCRPPETFKYCDAPLYDEITSVDLDGVEQVKYVSDNSTKVNYPMNPDKRDVSLKENTYVKAESYFDGVKDMEPGDIYVSDVIGAYVGSNRT